MKKGLLFTGLIVALTIICCYALVAADAVKERVVITEPVTIDAPAVTPVQTAPLQSKADKATRQVTAAQASSAPVDEAYLAKLELEKKAISKPSRDPLDVPPANDLCANEQLVAVPSSTAGTTLEAASECGYGGGDVYYYFTLAECRNVTISLCNSVSIWDSYMWLYDDECCGASLVAEDDDGCGVTYEHGEITMNLDAGTYHLCVDGWTGENGDFTLDIIDNGPCTVPHVEECPDGSLFSQPPTHPDSSWSGMTSDAGPGYLRAENFWGVCEEICDIHFWGLNLFHDGTAWNDCPYEDPMTFDIVFYYDASGFTGPGMWTVPGAVASSYTVSLTRTLTPYVYAVYPVYYYSTILTPCVVPMSAGWVSIQGVSVGTPDDCWFLWSSHGNAGDGSGYTVIDGGAGWELDDADLSLCLTGEISIGAMGACVDVETGICADDVLCEDCVGDFYWNMTCAQVPVGACCDQSTGDCWEDVFYGYCEYQGFDWYQGITCAEIFPPCGADLCDASGGCDEYISNVEMGSDCYTAFSNPSICDGYYDYYLEDPPGCATLYAGQANPITVSNGNPYSTDVAGLWIDWNQDYDFYDAGEMIYDETSWSGFGPYIGTITPHDSLDGGCYRMRVRIQYGGIVDPCGATSYGEVEDYCVCVCNETPIIELPYVMNFSTTVNTCGYCAYVPVGQMGEFGDGCGYYYIYMGPSVLYKMHTYETGTITVTTTGDDPAQYIFTDLCDPFGTCVAGSDWTGGNPSSETCVLTDLPAGIYYINVALWDDGSGRCGDIQLDITGDVYLPVELSSFEAIAGNHEVALTWTTAAELNNDYFEVQRSVDSDWTTVGTVEGTNEATGSSYAYTDRAVVNDVTYTYRLLSYDINGAVNEYEMTAEATPQAPLPTEYALSQNFPNPFNPTTTITYALKDAGFVTLKVYNLLGQEVANLVSQQLNAGNYTANFNGTDLPSGIYVYRLEVNDFSAQQKMVLLK